MKEGEKIYSKMFKIDIVIQQITLIIIIIIIIPLYYMINNFLVVFWGKEKNQYIVQMHLSRRSSWVSLIKKTNVSLSKQNIHSHILKEF